MKKRVHPDPNQESVWDYPRPPRVERSDRHVQVVYGGRMIADSHRAIRVLETSHPPVYYIPLTDIVPGTLVPTSTRTSCEYKGIAQYFDVSVGGRVAEAAAWHYPSPAPGYELLRDHVAFYPGRMDACYLSGEQVSPQPGGFYGGWITNAVVGPFKGEPGTMGW